MTDDEDWDSAANPSQEADARSDYLALIRADIEWWKDAERAARDKLSEKSAALSEQPDNLWLKRQRERADKEYRSIAEARYLCEQFYKAAMEALPFCSIKF